MTFKKTASSLLLGSALVICNISTSLADSTSIVTIGANNSEQQRNTILKYFGVNENEVEIIEVNNQDERKYLEGIATEAQIGRKTYSCAYVEPTKEGSGINVKTANISWLTPALVASTLTTSGVTSANVIVASAIPNTSGTGALTGIMKAFESATGEELDETKKELASEELIITGDLGEDVGQNVATGIVNDIKTEIIKNGTSDTTQIANTINNITNNYNVTLSSEQQEKIEKLMLKISQQNYDYNTMKEALNSVKESVRDTLKEEGIKVNQGLWDSVKDFFGNIGNWFSDIFKGSDTEDLGILGSTNDSLLGENATINSTDKNAINLPSSEDVEGFFSKIWNWFKGLFDSNSNDSIESQEVTEDSLGDVEVESVTEELIEESFDETPTGTELNIENEESTSINVEETSSESDITEEESNEEI